MKNFQYEKTISDFLDTLQSRILSGKILTKYSHLTKITSGIIETDCSGFVSYVLSETGHQHSLQEIFQYKRKIQKSAQDWNKIFVRNFTYFLENASPMYWVVLTDPNSLSDGDIIFSTNAPIPDRETNHCMFVRCVTQITKNKYELAVMDCTKSLIHFNDTRLGAGIGFGKIIIEKDSNNKYWKCNFSPKFPILHKKLLFARVL